MMQEWTNEQEEAILDRGNNLLVSAAAGSGKTAVLVERIIRLIIQDQDSIEDMLIVTFTQAAAGEMRERISQALLKELARNDHRGEYLRAQINLLNRASISTLHAFCMEVVRRYFHVLDINPKFRVGDTTETGLMKLEVLEELLENEYEKHDPAFLRLVEMFGGGRDDSPLQDLVLRTYEFIQSKPDPLAWLHERAGDFKLEPEEFSCCSWLQSLTGQLRIELGGVLELLQEALAMASLPEGPGAYQPALRVDLDTVTNLAAALDVGLPEFYRELQRVEYPVLARAGRDTDPRLQEEVKALREQGKRVIKDIQSKIFFQSPEEFCRDLNDLYPGMEYLYRLVADFTAGYRELKADKGMVDFNDLEHFALAILADQQIAGEYRNKYQYIFVDEYQDSNLVQETILNLIKRQNNLFLVGDVKQSIYRFRLADPSLFMEKYKRYLQVTEQPERRISLSMNFRSRPEIIRGVNDIFSRVMSQEFGEIDYTEEVYLRPGIAVPADIDEEMAAPALELILIDKNSNSTQLPEPGDDTGAEEEAGDIETEARIAAQKINELYGRNFYDSKLGCSRPLEYRDMVILMRTTRQQADLYYETLMAAGIPVYADTDRGYFAALEINIFMNLLRIIDNKRQDIPLVSVLRSPIGGFSVDDLIAIRLGCPDAAYCEAVENYIRNHQDHLQSRLREFIDRLDSWKEEARFKNMDEFIWQLMIETGYYYYVGAMPGGAQRQANLRILLDRANQYQATSLKGLYHFIKFVDKLQAGSGDMGMAKILGENENVVRIMSIHKSKGLEFPVVILVGTGRGFNLSDTRAAVLFHKDLGIGPCYVDPDLRVTRDTIARIALRNRIKMESLAEELRILYVACTRPRDKLVLIGSIRDLPGRIKKWSKSISPFQLARGMCQLDWIGPVIMRHADGEKLRGLDPLAAASGPDRRFDYHWLVKIIDRSDKKLTAPPRQEEIDFAATVQKHLSEANSPEQETIRSRLNWQYPFAGAVRIPSKVSVSQVKNLKESGLECLGRTGVPMTVQPGFMQVERAESAGAFFSGADKGTIMHLVMQHLDFKQVNTAEEIDRQIRAMTDRELLQEEAAAIIDRSRILHFFHSALGQRVLKAGRVRREVPFNLVCQASSIFADLRQSDEELLLQGVIDLYFQEGEELVLIDYKTDRITPENREGLIEKYRTQILLYKDALEKILGLRVKAGYLYLFDSEEEVVITA